ncbi:MAG: SAM-dependent chlorinase/fluorinase [Elusimicrobia bacterium]|nr:SAM-dependent chlorinase/fluorinase [Elusimicrobiota bacterium]
MSSRTNQRVIALLTDFGHQDPFVGVMKGVILSINPQVQVVDLCHALDPFDIRQAAFHLVVSAPYFPSRTIFLCVVDPGVGSGRRLLAAETARYTFLGPDNGVLSWVMGHESPKTMVSIENAWYFRHPVSSTFHGRDILAPVAAHLSRGTALHALGPAVQRWVRLPFPHPEREGDRWVGEVLTIDRFGNLITTFGVAHEPLVTLAKGTRRQRLVFSIRGRRIHNLSPTFAAAATGAEAAAATPALLAVIGSSGYVEIAQREGNAAKTLKASVGTQIWCQILRG